LNGIFEGRKFLIYPEMYIYKIFGIVLEQLEGIKMVSRAGVGRAIIVLFLIGMATAVFADQKTTTMTWVVPVSKSHSIAYGSGCSQTAFFFVESDANIDNDIDGNALRILPTNHRFTGTGCQTSATAGMTITNTGNQVTNIDGNFGGNLDSNIVLKVWMGTGAGCGTNGYGGWARLCPLFDNNVVGPVSQTQCRDFNTTTDLVGAKLIHGLTVNETNQLCFSGEFAGPDIGGFAGVPQNDYNGTFQTSTDFS